MQIKITKQFGYSLNGYEVLTFEPSENTLEVIDEVAEYALRMGYATGIANLDNAAVELKKAPKNKAEKEAPLNKGI